jgi:hypothetical protein
MSPWEIYKYVERFELERTSVVDNAYDNHWF